MNIVQIALAGPASRTTPGVWVVCLVDKTRLNGEIVKTNDESIYAVVEVGRYKYFHIDKVATMYAA